MCYQAIPIEMIQVFPKCVDVCVGEVHMGNQILKIQLEISNEFDVLWELCEGGPDASVVGFRSEEITLAIPRSPRRLRVEDFRQWLLP